MKKIVSLLIAAILTIGMTATAFADATNPKITKQISAIANVDAGEQRAGAKIFLPLKKEAFEGAVADLTGADVKTSKITVRQATKIGANAIESVEIKEDSNKNAGILITLIKPFASVKPQDFEISIYLNINGVRQNHETFVTGTITNGETIVYADTDYIDLSNGSTAACEETANKVEVYLGDEVSMFVKMLKGKNYAGTATTEPEESDLAVFDKYPDISDSYTLSVIDLSTSGKPVKITAAEKSYVYNADMELIGDTSEMLPFSKKYYLATKKLDIVADSSDPEDEPSDDESIDEPSDADSAVESSVDSTTDNLLPAVAPKGNGGNPDTGVSPMLGVAMVAAMLSLGTVTAISLNKKK